MDGRNPGGSILPLLGTQDRRLGSPPDDVTIPFNPTGKHLNSGAISLPRINSEPKAWMGLPDENTSVLSLPFIGLLKHLEKNSNGVSAYIR